MNAKIKNIIIKENKKIKNNLSLTKTKKSSSKNKLSYQSSPQFKYFKNNDKTYKNKFHFNKRTKMNINNHIGDKSNINKNSNSKFHMKRAYSKSNVNLEIKNINFTNGSHFQTSSNNNHSFLNINKYGKKIFSQKIININELNISNIKTKSNEQNNIINSFFETNNSSDINNNKNHNDFFSLNKSKNSSKKINISSNYSLNNTGSNSNSKNYNYLHLDKFQNKNLFQEYQGNTKKAINKCDIHNETYNKSLKNNNSSSYSNFNISISKQQSKIKSKINLSPKNKNISPYIHKENKIGYSFKPYISNFTHSKKPIIITKSNSKPYQGKEKIDVQITSINNLLNNKFIKDLNNIQNEMDRNMKLNKDNSKSKKYNTIKQFFEKFIKILGEYLNKNSFNCINIFLQKIINNYHDLLVSFSSENKKIQRHNIKLKNKIELMQKNLIQSENEINLLQQKNLDLINKVKIKKSGTKDSLSNIIFELKTPKSNINKLNESYGKDDYNHKLYKLNEKNLDDLDALYFFDKINTKCKRSSSRGIPLIPIIENNDEGVRKTTFSKKIDDLKSNYFLEIKNSFE